MAKGAGLSTCLECQAHEDAMHQAATAGLLAPAPVHEARVSSPCATLCDVFIFACRGLARYRTSKRTHGVCTYAGLVCMP